jgi:hypothetical protein
LNNALTRFIFSYRRKTSKYAAVILGLFVGFGFIGTANAVQTGMIQVTCTNGTFNVGWDNSNSYFEGRGNIAAFYCQVVHNTGYISDSLSDPSLRYYQGVLPIVDTPTATDETHTAQVPPSQETSTAPSLPQETTTPVDIPETETSPVVIDSETVVAVPVETPSVPSESSTQTIPSETSTPIVETPLPTPTPVVEPQPIVYPEPVVIPQPEPQPQPEPEPLPVEIDEEAPLEEPTEPEPIVEEPLPVDEPSEYPIEEDTNEILIEDEILEQTEPTPEPSPQPSVEPEPTSQPEIAPITPIVSEPMVTLDNGVVLTEEEAVAVVLLQNPAELLSELFTDPGAVLTALGSVGADMTPEEREESEKVVVSAIIAGGIATQSAAAAAGAAAYRRKP